MATPADQRLLELLDKWLKSLELHSKYASLDDDSYSKIQPWPQHQRPSRWIIDLAKQKALVLHGQIQERIAMGDAKFADSLELMTFLANLVGSEHIERFIPLADADGERILAPEESGSQSKPAPGDTATVTREMPKFLMASGRDPAPAGTTSVARTERKAQEVKPAAKPAKPKPPAADPQDRSGPSAAAREQVIADAARLVQWGRKWYELAELIASMADRPHLTDVRRILKDNKAVIDKKAGRG
ncbi:MAG: hypothetical protein JWN43_2883 [Gammaproteobacteria bacterium]|nr:hypothetical protein [Gammaproteobacteria bacterium]